MVHLNLIAPPTMAIFTTEITITFVMIVDSFGCMQGSVRGPTFFSEGR